MNNQNFSTKFKSMSTFFSLSALLISTTAIAQTTTTEAEEKIMALELVKDHSETVACNTSFEDEKSLSKHLKNVYTMGRDPELGGATYFVLWSGDVGCAGGSGTGSQIISEVNRLSDSRSFYVMNNNAFNTDNSYIPRFPEPINGSSIEKLEKVNNNKFFITSLDYGENDANCCPSARYQFTLEQIKYKWKVTNKKFLGNKKYN